MTLASFEVALVAAVLLAAVEVATGTFVFLSFSLGCVAVAALEAFGGSPGLWRDTLAFVVVAAAAMAGLRLAFGHRGDSKRAEGDVNEY